MRAGVIRPETNRKTDDGSRLPIGAAIDSYLDWVNHNRSHRTYQTYRYTLDTLLRKSYTKGYVREAERDDMLKFMTDCYKQGLGARTVYDKLVVALQMFKHFGVTKLLRPSDWPDYVETIRPIYEAEEIRLKLQYAEGDDALFIKFLLGSGFRDQESQHVTFRDIDFLNCLGRVTAKPRWGFQPKNHEERAVPVPTPLIEQLLALKRRRDAFDCREVREAIPGAELLQRSLRRRGGERGTRSQELRGVGFSAERPLTTSSLGKVTEQCRREPPLAKALRLPRVCGAIASHPISTREGL